MQRDPGPSGAARPAEAELAGILANWEALETAMAHRFDGAILDDARQFQFRCGLRSGFMNGVLRTRVAPGDLEGLVAETRTWFPADVAWRWIVGSTSAPADLAARLEAAGLQSRRPPLAAMTVNLRTWPEREWAPVGLLITEVTDAADLDDWLTVRNANHPLDATTVDAWRRSRHDGPIEAGEADAGVRQFVARFEGRPVAGATLFLDAATGTAGLYHVDVVPDARGMGFGTAVSAAALDATADQGYALGVLTATALGTPVYLRLGFQVVGSLTVFVGDGG